MKFKYEDMDAIAKMTITSNAIELQKHNRVVGAALLSADVTAKSNGLLIIKSIISGKPLAVLQAYKVAYNVAAREAAR
ncbi:hypothetical protein ACM55O_21020 [Hafnia paralvei]|uniref:hypothetical protein n=1 Tax=Hafnia paralvei TaxID=546367 RepID=UPI0039FCC025